MIHLITPDELKDRNKKEYVIIGENDSEDWDVLSNWYVKPNQTPKELYDYALNNFCLTFDDAVNMKETQEIKDEGKQYRTIKIVHISHCF
jgi:hypothetical protein